MTTPVLKTMPNKAFNGKTMKDEPVKAVIEDTHYLVNGDTVATGQTASEAKANAVAVLLDAYACNQRFPQVRLLDDGSVMVGREPRTGEVEYTRFAKDAAGRTRSWGSSYGRLIIYAATGERHVSLSVYMDDAAAKYNEVTVTKGED